MNWIDLGDRDKLLAYAKQFGPGKFRIFNANEAESHYFDCAADDGLYGLSIMEYDIDNYIDFRDGLKALWEKAGCREAELLATMVAAIALKHKPKPEDNLALTGQAGDLPEDLKKKTAYESISPGDAPPVYVYEF